MHIGGNWIASDLVAGVSAGSDALFGTDDDVRIPGGSQIIATVAAIIIKGTASGSGNETDHFGFVSQQITALKIAGTQLALVTGPGNDLLPIPVGSNGNIAVREVI